MRGIFFFTPNLREDKKAQANFFISFVDDVLRKKELLQAHITWLLEI